MILIALGANIPSRHGNPEATLEAAKYALVFRGVRILSFSRIWLSAPVPVSEQPLYRNAVASIETQMTPQELMRVIKEIERDFGRHDAEKNAPRELDIDLLAYDDVVYTEGALLVPHPRMHSRAFVMMPLCEIAPDWMHPVLKKTASELAAFLPEEQYVKPIEAQAA
jgi:2-amino-4-hydroxy-6-hydroxymethyldihydropteridine diphosphokinase